MRISDPYTVPTIANVLDLKEARQAQLAQDLRDQSAYHQDRMQAYDQWSKSGGKRFEFAGKTHDVDEVAKDLKEMKTDVNLQAETVRTIEVGWGKTTLKITPIHKPSEKRSVFRTFFDAITGRST